MTSIRTSGYGDYGFAPGEEKAILEYIRKPYFKHKTKVLESAREAKEEMASELYASIMLSMSYERLDTNSLLPMRKEDFYGYRRKSLHLVREFLIKEDEWKYGGN